MLAGLHVLMSQHRPANHLCLNAWAAGLKCLENVSDAWNNAMDLELKCILGFIIIMQPFHAILPQIYQQSPALYIMYLHDGMPHLSQKTAA